MVVRLSGGLGNQLFQYAFGRAIAEREGVELCLDTWSFINDKLRDYELYNYKIKNGRKRWIKRFFCNIMYQFRAHFFDIPFLTKVLSMEYEETVFVKRDLTNISDGAYCVGFWQNIVYFEDIRDVLLQEFQYIGNISEAQKAFIRKIESENSIAMHVRRGDYLVGAAQSMYESLSKEYYMKALQYIREAQKNTKVYIFSDDIEWCKKEYAEVEDVCFVDNSISDSQHIDLEIMRHCKHFVIANSTFSWWASWLSQSEDKIVVAPKNWFFNQEDNANVQKALLRDAVLM